MDLWKVGWRGGGAMRSPAGCYAMGEIREPSPHPPPLSRGRERGAGLSQRDRAGGPGAILFFGKAKSAKIGKQCRKSWMGNNLPPCNNQSRRPDPAADVKGRAGRLTPCSIRSYEEIGPAAVGGHIGRGRETIRFRPDTASVLEDTTSCPTTTCETFPRKAQRELLRSDRRNGKKTAGSQSTCPATRQDNLPASTFLVRYSIFNSIQLH